MSAVADKPFDTRNSLLRSVVLGGLLIGIAHSIVYHVIISSVIGGNPIVSVYQFVASGVLGMAAFEGGVPAALLGLLLHFVISMVIAGVFIVTASRIPLLRRNVIVGSLLYGVGVHIVMQLIVFPLSAVPPFPAPSIALIVRDIVEHALVVGLPLGILVQRNVSAHQ